MAAASLASAASDSLFGSRGAEFGCGSFALGSELGDPDWIREGELGIGEFELYTRVTRVVAGFGVAV